MLLLQMGSPFEYRGTKMQWVGRDGYMLWKVEFNSREVLTIHPTEIFVSVLGRIAGANPRTILDEQNNRTTDLEGARDQARTLDQTR